MQQSVKAGLSLTEEHQDSAKPLHRSHDVAKQKDGAEDGEELPRGGDDGAGQRPEVHHRHKDEGLVKKNIWIYSIICKHSNLLSKFFQRCNTTLTILSYKYPSTHLS